MSRIARIVLKEIPYHITERGNARQRVFFDEWDCRLYLDLLRHYAASAGLRLWAYCLMPNHVHLVAVPERPASMASALGRTHADYARHFNLKHRSCGHVWQARFFSCPLEPAHLWRAMSYMERNPTRAGLVKRAEQYPWSSAAIRLDESGKASFLDMSMWRANYTREQWVEALRSSLEEEAFGRRLQEASRRGRPLGEEEFVTELEGKAGRRLRPSPPGRPRKEKTACDEQMTLKIGV